WDGRAKTLEDQIDGPVTNPIEMGSQWDQVVGKLKADASYSAAFSSAFPDGVTHENVRTAIATFERTLITRGSPFDRWMQGEATALTDEQKRGYDVFKSIGCIACHQGSNVGGNMFQRFGVIGDYFEDRGNIVAVDYGRYNVTKNEADKFVFK